MKNVSLSEKLVILKEKIAERTSEIDKSKGKLSMLQDNLKKMGFQNVEQAKIELKEIHGSLENKRESFNLKIKNLERRIEDENN